MNQLITIIGPTASGKTTLAVALATRLHGEILSGDSRQVYKAMDIGTGKDICEYQHIPYHLIDICNAGYKYNLYEFQRDFHAAYNDIIKRNVQPILCGGTGLYIEAVLKGYDLPEVPQNQTLRNQLKNKTLEELTLILSQYKTLHNTTDIDSAQRAVRAIEIAEFNTNHPTEYRAYPALSSIIFGVDIDREVRRERITKRLHQRLEEGMIEEVKKLIDSGIPTGDLEYYGLEYKYITQYLTHQLNYQEMVSGLEIAIHQFAKRQMTWFRGMEKRGFKIHWIDGMLPIEEKTARILAEIG